MHWLNNNPAWNLTLTCIIFLSDRRVPSQQFDLLSVNNKQLKLSNKIAARTRSKNISCISNRPHLQILRNRIYFMHARVANGKTQGRCASCVNKELHQDVLFVLREALNSASAAVEQPKLFCTKFSFNFSFSPPQKYKSSIHQTVCDCVSFHWKKFLATPVLDFFQGSLENRNALIILSSWNRGITAKFDNDNDDLIEDFFPTRRLKKIRLLRRMHTITYMKVKSIRSSNFVGGMELYVWDVIRCGRSCVDYNVITWGRLDNARICVTFLANSVRETASHILNLSSSYLLNNSYANETSPNFTTISFRLSTLDSLLVRDSYYSCTLIKIVPPL